MDGVLDVCDTCPKRVDFDGDIDNNDDVDEDENDDDKRSGFVTVALEMYDADDFLNGSTVVEVDDKNVT